MNQLKLNFLLRFYTNFGEHIFIEFTNPILNNRDTVVPLNYIDTETWGVELDFSLPIFKNENIEYTYFFKNTYSEIKYAKHKYIINNEVFKKTKTLYCFDDWFSENNEQFVFYREPFKNILLNHNQALQIPDLNKMGFIEFRVNAPFLRNNQQICLIGSIPTLNNWHTNTKPLILNKHNNYDYYYINLDFELNEIQTPIEYKYGIFDTEKNTFLQFENGKNRVVHLPNILKNVKIIKNDGFLDIQNLYFKGVGVAIPVFSLKTKCSGGIGEFNDLKYLADWAEKIGLQLIQILPINDTTSNYTWEHSYPCSAISAFALHPIYIHLDELFTPEQLELKNNWLTEKNLLNELTFVDFEKVILLKWKYIKLIFESISPDFFKQKDYQHFYEENKNWLISYCVFCTLRDTNKTTNFKKWKTHKTYNERAIQQIFENDENIKIHLYVQYILHCQLLKAKEYAHTKRIIFKGDIAIGVARNGVDVWQNPSLFHTKFQAGAPPDDFSDKGQNWNFPTYNWQAMKAENYSWWKNRFKQMNYYFDAFRIDHILGFFRIWSIPINQVEGIFGHFEPVIPITVEILNQNKIHQNIFRFTKPYITKQILIEIFGQDSTYIESHFLNPTNEFEYELKSEFQTQVDIEKNILKYTDSQSIKQGLFDLVSNVILLEDEQEGQYHFRFFMQKTFSYKHVDNFTKEQLNRLYNEYFFSNQNQLWEKEAMEKLPTLKDSTNMLICGEDLGLVPTCVPKIMNNLSILGLEVQRMPKDTSQKFSNPNNAPYLSVVTISSHDTSTIRAWWEEDRKLIQNFYNEILHFSGVPPYYCEDWVVKKIFEQHLYSPAMWAIFQLQDFFALDPQLRVENPNSERINNPANAKHYWRYRIHLNLEDLIKNDPFNQLIKALLKYTNRI